MKKLEPEILERLFLYTVKCTVLKRLFLYTVQCTVLKINRIYVGVTLAKDCPGLAGKKSSEI